RTDEALPLLDRATAIHAFEGRITQVAYCSLTRSRLMHMLGRFDAAERSAREAAIVFNEHGNDDGWVAAGRLLLHIEVERNRYQQAKAILDEASQRRKLRPALAGKLVLQRAQVAWAEGQLRETATFARQALSLLPSGYRRERADAQTLGRLAGT